MDLAWPNNTKMFAVKCPARVGENYHVVSTLVVLKAVYDLFLCPVPDWKVLHYFHIWIVLITCDRLERNVAWLIKEIFESCHAILMINVWWTLEWYHCNEEICVAIQSSVLLWGSWNLIKKFSRHVGGLNSVLGRFKQIILTSEDRRVILLSTKVLTYSLPQVEFAVSRP